MFRQLEVPILGIVENMSYLELPDGTRMDVFGTGGGEQLADSMNVPFLGKVPMDPEVRIGGDSGKPVIAARQDSAVAKSLREIAEKVAAAASVAALEKGSELSISIEE